MQSQSFGLPQSIGVRRPNGLKTSPFVSSDAVAVALVCRRKGTCFRSYRNLLLPSDGFLPPGMPVPLHLAAHPVRLVRRVPVEAAVRALAVVELHGLAHTVSHLPDTGAKPLQDTRRHGALRPH